jgi:hypothetical protein
VRGFPLKYLMALLCAALLNAGVDARPRRKALPAYDWNLTAALAVVYNDNFLGISPSDRTQYVNSTGLFATPLESVDDVQSELQLKPEVRWRAPWKLMASADYRLKIADRFRNGFTNYQSHTLNLGLRPRIQGYNWTAHFRAMVIPSYYLRVYYDRDYRERHAARYRNWDYEGSFRLKLFDPLWTEIKGGWGSFFYNAKFTEYDSDYRDFGLSCDYRTPWDATLSAGYLRRLSTNVGKDQIGSLQTPTGDSAPGGDSEYGDADFNEDDFTGGIQADLPWLKKLRPTSGLAYRMRRRVFTTDRDLALDPLHRGRVDRRYEITVSLGFGLTKNLEAETFYSYEERTADSQNPAVPQVKNFVRRQVGLQIAYSLN